MRHYKEKIMAALLLTSVGVSACSVTDINGGDPNAIGSQGTALDNNSSSNTSIRPRLGFLKNFQSILSESTLTKLDHSESLDAVGEERIGSSRRRRFEFLNSGKVCESHEYERTSKKNKFQKWGGVDLQQEQIKFKEVAFIDFLGVGIS